MVSRYHGNFNILRGNFLDGNGTIYFDLSGNGIQWVARYSGMVWQESNMPLFRAVPLFLNNSGTMPLYRMKRQEQQQFLTQTYVDCVMRHLYCCVPYTVLRV